MASRQEDYFIGDDLDAIFAVIDEDCLERRPGNNVMTQEEGTAAPGPTFSCDLCDKICLTKRGLTRHINAKHPTDNTSTAEKQASTTTKSRITAEEILHPLYFKKIIEKSIKKVTEKGYYPDSMMNELRNYETSLNNVMAPYNLVKDTIISFKASGNDEKFYPAFYKCVSDAESFLQGVSKMPAQLVGFEAAYHVRIHISGGMNNKGDNNAEVSRNSFSEKDRSIICYLAGYVFGTLYRRLRFSSNKDTDYNQQCLSILSDEKSTDADPDLPDHKLVTSRNRSGLWKVTKDVIDVFAVAEEKFQNHTKSCTTKINDTVMVAELLKDVTILSRFSKIRSSSNLDCKKEVALNLLEDALGLYIRTRTFSYVNDKLQNHKMKNSQIKSKPLRTDLKQKSSNLDQGH